MSISNEKLLLISALAYYEELSDRHVYDDNIDDDIIKVNDVLDRIIKDDKTTCFDGAFGYSDSELGMDKIIALIRSDEELLDLEIIYPEKENDATTSSVCLVNPATQDVYVVYVGNYAEGSYTYMDDEGKITDIDSWVNNGQGATLADTDEQKRDLDLYIASINAVREYLGDYEKDLNITVCGHSTGGNHAQYVTITYPESDEYTDINDIDRCVSFDGQGFSEAFLEKYSSQISNRADKITSYCPTVSIVGALLNTIPGINQKYIDIGRPDALGIGLHMPAELINDEGEFKIEGYPSMEYQLLNAYSSWVFKIADMIPGIDVDNASNGFGEFLALIVNSNDIRDVGDAITILSTT